MSPSAAAHPAWRVAVLRALEKNKARRLSRRRRRRRAIAPSRVASSPPPQP
ncbi:uncharacterized protein MICPUCDRAFT_56823 [Micromonas pusilla CCMP1545]|jgi:hypothetical protein|uniref:Predicted protein n=1 Tax=Micromonas pusilla (strain CCMP1545) TaxID=564608 RepID=C1MN87_MICPC|nr:uncharacterized protein MICPUCDRAFT_56823 [Micromonas pusilla CCMP1545]EEH58707.1 predicted protein [Micromonas pusilla CCMP1545]|eukprot:XP_003057062.1 predicted protein [Micromonas pusilla CCMP1545]